MSYVDDYLEMRRKGTPLIVVKSSDYRATIEALAKVRLNGEDPVAFKWDCVNGCQYLGEQGWTADMPMGNRDKPVELPGSSASMDAVVGSAIGTWDNEYMEYVGGLPKYGVLFMVIPDTFADQNHVWTNPVLTQAVAIARDALKAPFKSLGFRTIVFVSIDGKLPSLVVDDCPILSDNLPELPELIDKASSLSEGAGLMQDPDVYEKAAKYCQGMTRFSAEGALARCLRKSGYDLGKLATVQRDTIEASSKGLTFERGNESFDDIGGLSQIKSFAGRLFRGKRPPSVVVRIEEIEKSMAGIGVGGVGDSSGTSMDQLGVLLNAMEEYRWTGLIAVGPPGSGKSLVSKTMANTYKCPAINLDLGALKGQFVGQSEQQVRKAIGVLKSFAGTSAFFVATSNGLAIIPPELRRRFTFGIWYFGLLSKEEKVQVWAINRAKYEIPADDVQPEDSDYVGSDIRNVCDLAQRLQCPLVEAANYIVPVAKSDPGAIQRLQDAAHGKFLDASSPGVFMKGKASSGEPSGAKRSMMVS